MTDETLLDTDEAARFLRLPVSTLKHFRRTNQGPTYVSLGRRVFYRRVDLVAYVAANTVETGASA